MVSKDQKVDGYHGTLSILKHSISYCRRMRHKARVDGGRANVLEWII